MGPVMKKIFYSLIVSFLIQISIYSQEGWFQQSVVFSGSNFNSVKFLNDSIGWAVGGRSILKTTDGGRSWFVQLEEASNELIDIYFIEETGWVVGAFGTILKSIDGGENWTIQNSGTSYWLYSVFFTDKNNGWVVGRYTVLKTTDGGTNWDYQSLNSILAQDVFFIDQNIGWIAGDKIYKTIDGGGTWVLQSDEVWFKAIHFIDQYNGWGIGLYATPGLYSTTDGGSSWTNHSISASLRSLFFVNSDLGWVVGSESNIGVVYKTSDAGANWIKQINEEICDDLFAVDFIDENSGWAVGWNGGVIKTTNGGNEWINPVNWLGKSLYSFESMDENNCWTAGENGTILKTTNSGTNWVDHSIQTLNLISDIFFINQDNGWIVGSDNSWPFGSYRGICGKTTNNGIDWLTQDLTWVPSSVFFINQNMGWIAGSTNEVYPNYNGVVYKSTDGGNTWINKFNGSDPSGFIDIYFKDEGNGWVVGNYGEIFMTTDGGDNWIEQSIGNDTYRQIFFINESFGWITGTSELLITTDGGFNWNVSNVPTNGGLNSAYFVNQNIGWVVGGNVYYNEIWKTTDGGINWINSFNGIHNLYSVYFINENIGWTVGEDGIILKTTNGGTTFLEEESEITKTFALSQNFPNPFNPVTTISYQIPQTGFVSLKVYDILGREVATLVNEEKPAGSYEVEFNPASSIKNPASGIYFYQLQAGNYSETKKMILLR